ncbi:hypothetical protein SUGI_0404470 [Cryptomeria japonica]|nr:hypothetical protein SUGI_0404470 [Cryptomeria japonica]
MLHAVISENSAILELLLSEDEVLLILHVVDLRFHIFDSVRALEFQGEGFDKDLHSTKQAKHKVKVGPLDVVTGKGSTVFQLLTVVLSFRPPE